MKVKVGDKVYDANDAPVMVILSDQDKENIANMGNEAHKYCCYPEGMDAAEISLWMSKV